MLASKATTPAGYLLSLPPERRRVIRAVRAVVKKRLPKGYVESVNWGMLAYEVPLRRYADTYNKQPLTCVALAAQKHYYALYLMGVYGDEALLAKLVAAYQAVGKRLDMGKACLRFTTLEDLPLDAIGDIVASVPVERLIEVAEAARQKKSGETDKRSR